jgi:hypothetical protein
MMRTFLLALLVVVSSACSKPAAPPDAPSQLPVASATASEPPIVKATSCTPGWMTYLGFHGSGPPTQALLRAIRARFPDALVVDVEPGNLGVIIAETHSMDVRARHEAAAASVGWKGDTADFPRVTADCTMTFNTPLPPPK